MHKYRKLDESDQCRVKGYMDSLLDNSSKVEMDYKQDSHYEETVMMKSPKTYEEL